MIGSFPEEVLWNFASSKSNGRGKPCGGAFIAADYICKLDGGSAVEIDGGSPLKGKIDRSLDDKFEPTDHDLKMFKEGFERAIKNDNEWVLPFKIPAKYDDDSGTPEAVDEIASLRGSLKQDKKTGKISVPSGVKVSGKARELIDEYNELDLGIFYANSATGLALNVNGLGVMAGPRNSVPKDSIRGLVQYYALRRQDASLIEGPNGKIIDAYRDPFTGTPRSFYGVKIPKSGNNKGQEIEAILGSQDHWHRPFGIYGIKSENDVRNTMFMPSGMNSAKGEMSPTRFAYTVLAKNGVISDTKGLAQDKSVVGGFAARYAKAGSKYDFLPSKAGRDVEKTELGENATRLLNTARGDVTTKYVPRMEKDLAKGGITSQAAAKHMYSIAKQEAEQNYFGGYRRFTDVRVIAENEQQFVKGVNLNKPTKNVVNNIQANIEASGITPQAAVEMMVANHK
jgi:hypothetical protein